VRKTWWGGAEVDVKDTGLSGDVEIQRKWRKNQEHLENFFLKCL